MRPAAATSEAPGGGTTIDRVDLVDAGGDVWSRWEAADRDHPTPHAAASYHWNRSWDRSYGDSVDCRVLVAIAGGCEVGYWLSPRSANLSDGPVTVATQHLGTAGEPSGDAVFVEHNRPWLHPSLDPTAGGRDFLRRAIGRLSREPGDRIDLDGLPAELVPSDLLDAAHLERRDSPWFDFEGIDDGDLLASLRKKTRSNFRRAMKHYGPVIVEWTEADGDIPAAMRTLIDLHQSRWEAAGRAGAFGGDRFAPFLGDVVAGGRGAVAIARDDAGPIGATLLTREERRLLCLVVGFADTAVRQSPGVVSLVPIMQAALDRGYAGFEWLVGDSLYKRMLSTGTRELVWAKQPQSTLKMLTVRSLRAVKRTLDAARR